jgi:hypothetical protein
MVSDGTRWMIFALFPQAGGGRLVGVMGTDVPIQEITNLVPKGKLGANAYAFMYTHHGYVLFHPNMKPMYQKTVRCHSALML